MGFMLDDNGYMPVSFNRPAFHYNPMTIVANGTLKADHDESVIRPPESLAYLLAVNRGKGVSKML